MAIDIELKIENWKNKLLDLGKRNRLLNYRVTKRSSLQIFIPDCFSLWKTFVEDEKSLELPYFDDFSNEILDEDSYNVKTNQTIKEMQKTLRSLRDKAKTANEEQGINILYLSFGFLKWRESKSPDLFISPIILVPVKLTVESIASPYILSLHEDEIVLNPTLCHKLENDFGIHLPELNDEINIIQYFENIRKIVANNQWEVSLDISLSLLSFLKINMYNDLVKNKDKIKQNPIIRAISGDRKACNNIPKEIIDFDFDKNQKPSQVFQVVDADSSQQDAILCANKGISFVLQGPPGTGKSQTITNIISECLANGKKVLFVSEKMAALEVVHKRLTNAELDDFCLILHSHKANKKAVLNQLNDVLKIADKKVNLNDVAFQKLDALQSYKEKLNEYVFQLVTNIAPLDKSIFDANSILAHLNSYDEIIFSIKDVIKITKENYYRKLYLLEQFSDTIGRMTEDYSINPWKNTTVLALNNEFRHDINAKLSNLIPKVSNARQRTQRIFEEIELQWKSSYTSLLQLIRILDLAKQSPVVPTSWITNRDIRPFFEEVSKCEERNSSFFQKQVELKELFNIISTNDRSIINLETSQLVNTNSIKDEIGKVKAALAKSLYSNWELNESRVFLLIDQTKEKVGDLRLIKAEIFSQFENSIFSIDFQAIYNRYKTEYTSFLKYFKKQYRYDKKAILVHNKKIVRKVSDDMVLDIINKLQTYSIIIDWFSKHEEEITTFFGDLYNRESTDFILIDKYIITYKALKKSNILLNELLNIAGTIEQEEINLNSHYDFLYKGIKTDWVKIRQSLTWATSFKLLVDEFYLNIDFVESVCSKPETIKLCEEYSLEIQIILKDIDIEFKWFLSLFDEVDEIKHLTLTSLQYKLEQCRNNLFLLEEWIDFQKAREDCKNEGLSDYISNIEELHIDRRNIIPCFNKRFFRLWLDAVLPNYPAILSFRRRTHERTIIEFSELDKLQFKISKAIIKSKLINNLPQMNHFTSGYDEIGILKREINKQRKIMPVRKLFKEIPNLLPILKPCLMMSPLSVSLFLEGDTYQFDTVIFDEASQVCTENAIGAIFRGKQVIIAGDSKQLPPTNFFTASTSDVEYDLDDEVEDDSSAYESILDEANLLPEKTLLWHYRSKHEHLIAFSNSKIYRNSLITFPSNKENTKDYGVEYIYVKDGFYDRGGRTGNTPEAKKVAELVFEHFRNQPKRSLGVIAFGEVQQQAIDTEIRLLRYKYQQFEHFFNEEFNEPFFIKNLENVQGDERDTIIFSIGYAKDKNGKMSMIFGPLSKSGGERRLNVAITRAKFNIKLVGSIMPADIELERISSDGPKLLRGYIDFALNGINTLIKTTDRSGFGWHNSSFEEAVYNFLDHKGYKVDKQVGCSGYRIDLAVKHPTLTGIYVLGIECDGAAYQSARTARERDRLRQDVLKNMGWKIYHIWSTDWIKDPKTEGDNLINTISDAISNLSTLDYKEDKKTLPDSYDFLSVNSRTLDLEERINPYKFEPLKISDYKDLPRDPYGYIKITDFVTELVKNEYPLHYELLCQKVAPIFGNEKATSKIRREVDATLNNLGKIIYRKRDFFYPSKGAEIIVRTPNIRNIKHIAIEEIAEAMIKILAHSYGINQEGLFTITRTVYGFGSSGKNIKIALSEAFDLLINSGRIEIIDGKLGIIQKNKS